VMFDEAGARDRREEWSEPVSRPRPSRATEAGVPIPAVPMADREMPIELTRTPELVHAWLDGEASQSALRGPEWSRHVEFWSRVDREIEGRRQIHAPEDLTARIMAALPDVNPRMVTPWWGRRISVNPVAIAIAAAGLLAVGAALGTVLHR
jgi:hypothetical protein